MIRSKLLLTFLLLASYPLSAAEFMFRAEDFHIAFNREAKNSKSTLRAYKEFCRTNLQTTTCFFRMSELVGATVSSGRGTPLATWIVTFYRKPIKIDFSDLEAFANIVKLTSPGLSKNEIDRLLIFTLENTGIAYQTRNATYTYHKFDEEQYALQIDAK